MTAVVFASLIVKVTDFVRLLANARTNVSAIVTQAVAWLVGIGAVWLASSAAVTKAIVLPGTSAALGTLDGGSIVLVGLLAASLASFGVDLKAAIDNTDSAKMPPMIGPPD